MKQNDLIRILGDVITDVDVLRSEFSRTTDNRRRLDDIRDELDGFQRRILRNLIDVNTSQFAELADSLTDANKELKQTIAEVDKVADTLETLVKFVGVVQKIVELIP